MKKQYKYILVIIVLVVLVYLIGGRIVNAESNSFINQFNNLSSLKNDNNFVGYLNNFLTDNNENIDIQTPGITILTPGAASDIETWGTCIINNNYYFNNNSIINYLMRRNTNVYCLSFSTSSINYEDLYFIPYTSSGIPRSVLGGGYSNSSYNINDMTLDLSKPIVIVFSPNKEYKGHKLYNYDGTNYTKPSDTNKEAYEELESLTNFVIYKYMETYYNAHYLDSNFKLKIPRINMIGHSRGGIINMQYAIEHPDIVDSLYSVGTPYNGSSVYNAFAEEGIDVLGLLGFSNDAMSDCVDDSIYKALKYYWNEYQSSAGYYHTKLYAIGGSMSFNLLSYLEGILVNNDSLFVKFLRWWFSSYTPLEEYDQFINPTKIDNDVLSTYHKDEKGLLVGEFIDVEDNFDLNIIENLLTSISLYVTGFNELSTSSRRHKAAQVIRGLLESMWFDYQTDQFVAKNDVLVDLNSQQAKGYHNTERFEKIFTYSNSDLSSLAYPAMPAVGHNLEPCDEDIINCILSNIVLGDNDNGFNLKYIDSTTLEYIGFSYQKAVSNGIMNLSHIDTTYLNYQISSKMFDCDYTLAQKLYKNENFYFNRTIDGVSNDGIHRINFDGDFKFELNTFTFLKGNVLFTKTAGSVITTNNNDAYSVLTGSLVLNNILVKSYHNTNNTNIYLSNVNIINDGAFLCQNIQKINMSLAANNKYEIGNYAFYGCSFLREINIDKDLSYVGLYAFTYTYIYDHNVSLIIRNALIKADRSNPLEILSDSPITYVAANAIRTDCIWNYMVIEKTGVVFDMNSINSYNIDSVILYTNVVLINNKPNISKEHFKNCTPIIYTIYSTGNAFNGLVIRDSINVYIQTPSNTFTKTLQIEQSNQNPVYTFSSNELFYGDYIVLGYTEDLGNYYINEVKNTINYFSDALKVFYAYYVCDGNHNYSLNSSYSSYHDYVCGDCCLKEKENHSFTYTSYDMFSHIKECFCGYFEYEEHVSSDSATFIDNHSHQEVCIHCGQHYSASHYMSEKIFDYNDYLYFGTVCDLCSYTIPQQLLSVTDNGENHLLSNGEYLPHEYIPMEFQGYTIMMCKYCGHHIHNGLIGSSDGNSTHSLYCELCQTVCHMPHTYSNYGSEDSDLYDGYHSSICDGCGYLLEEEHTYIANDNYEDGHHLICTLCGATTTWSHDPVNSCNPTPLFHTDYCEFCQCYYYVSHDFEFYDIIKMADIDDSGHMVRCKICGYQKMTSHIYDIYYDSSGHYNHCSICGYEESIVQHTPLFNCNSIDPHDHYMYCSGCGYTLNTTLIYTICAEYHHYCKCQICNLQILEEHEEDCTYYDDELHIYYCDLCQIQYLMPHFVNEHVIIYENYEPGYDLWVCTYCGYMEVRRREE